MVWLWILIAFIGLWMFLRHLPAGFDAKRPVGELLALTPLLMIPLAILTILSAVFCAWGPFILGLLLLGYELYFVRSYFFGKKPQSRQQQFEKDNVSLDELLKSKNPLDRLIFENEEQDQKKTSNAFLENTLGTAQVSEETDKHYVYDEDQYVTVMTLNCRYGRADADTIRDLVHEYHVCVLALQEVTDDLKEALIKNRLILDLPYYTAGEQSANDNGGFNMIWTRQSPEILKKSTINLEAAATPGAVISVGEHRLLIASVHPKSPHRGGAYWGYGITHLSQFITYTGASAPSIPSHAPAAVDPVQKQPPENIADSAIVMGDLNSSLDLPSFRSVLDAGFTDSSLEIHSGFHLAFPTSWPAVPRLLELDHVLHTAGLEAVEVHSIVVPGTDHASLIAVLRDNS